MWRRKLRMHNWSSAFTCCFRSARFCGTFGVINKNLGFDVTMWFQMKVRNSQVPKAVCHANMMSTAWSTAILQFFHKKLKINYYFLLDKNKVEVIIWLWACNIFHKKKYSTKREYSHIGMRFNKYFITSSIFNTIMFDMTEVFQYIASYENVYRLRNCWHFP